MVPSPRKRHIGWLLALPLLLAVIMFSGPAKSEIYGTTGDWIINVNDHGSCVLSRYVDDQFYAIGAEWDQTAKQFYWTVLFYSPELGRLPPGGEYPVDLKVQDAPWQLGSTAEIISAQNVSYVRVEIHDYDFGTAFREGSVFTVGAARKDYHLPLDGSADAQDIYVGCFLNSFVQPTAQNPFE